MQDKFIIELLQLRFYSYHGLFPDEKITGNEFEVDIRLSYTPVGKMATNIGDVIDYSKVYDLIRQQMREPRELLETLAMEITDQLFAMFTQTTSICIRIKKLHPPIASFTGSVAVTYERNA